MATGGGNTYLYDCQVKACQKFFREQLPKVPKCELLTEERKKNENMLYYGKPIYFSDITGFDAHKVIAVLSGIVNDRKKFTEGNVFLLRLCGTDKSEELFKLSPFPKKVQIGNGIVSIRPREESKLSQNGKTYAEMKADLENHFEKDTKRFAKDIKKLFRNNEKKLNKFPQATIEVYMILLFEIARRLVKLEKPNKSIAEYDDLPIGSAIAGIMKLLKNSDEGEYTFNDVFDYGGKFHCFSEESHKRKEAIDRINEAASVKTEGSEEKLIEEAIKELRKTFSREDSSEESSLTSHMGDLKVSEEKTSKVPTSST